MKVVIILATFVAVLFSMSYKMETRSTGSLRARLIKSNLYQQYLEQQNLRRTEILKKGSQILMDYYDDIYIVNVSIGTPGQTLSLLMDTGSSDLWVIDASCNTDPCNGYIGSVYSRHKFDGSKSSTFSTQNCSMAIPGWCDGLLVNDTVSIAGLSIEQQAFLSADDVDDAVGYLPLDGVLGLAWPALSQLKVATPLQNLLPSLDAPLFTIWMDRKFNISYGGDGGLITYGSIDTINCQSEVNYVPLSSETYWQFAIDGFAIGSFSEEKKEQAISNSDSSWFGVPTSIMDAVVNETGAQYDDMHGFYTVDCSTMKTLPDLQFTINGIKYNVSSEEFVIDLELGGGECALTFFEFDSGGFRASWILGDPWIRAFCNIYDVGQKRLGFAKAIHTGP